MRKSIGVMAMAMAMVLALTVAPALAGGKGRHKQRAAVTKQLAYTAATDVVYDIEMPQSIDNRNVLSTAVDQQWWFCDSKNTKVVNYESRQYRYGQSVPELNEYNASKVGLSGMTNESVMAENLNGFLGFDAAQKMVYVTFARQSCENVYTQEWDPETGDWNCTVEAEMTCEDLQYVISGHVMMTIVPYIQIVPASSAR